MILNKVHLFGRLTRDPELRSVGDTQVVGFGIAVNDRPYKKNGDTVRDVCFLDCEAWGTLANLISEHFKKGKPILVSGALKQENWEDKTSGQKRSKLKVRVSDFDFADIGPKKEEGEGDPTEAPAKKTRTKKAAAPAEGAGDTDAPSGTDDIPF